jgi:hypothetical protein
MSEPILLRVTLGTLLIRPKLDAVLTVTPKAGGTVVAMDKSKVWRCNPTLPQRYQVL